MIRRRNDHDPLAPSPHPRWLIVWDMQFRALEITELAAQTDLRALMARTAQQWELQGWTVESDGRFGSFFCHRQGQRRLIAISGADPQQSGAAGPSWHESCPTCGE